MVRFSQFEAMANEAKHGPKKAAEATTKLYDGPEWKLQERIKADLVARRWYVIGSRFGVKSTMDAGTPDIIAAGPNGITLWCECKSKGNKLTVEQNTARHILLSHNHQYVKAECFQDYLNKMNEILEII